MSLRHECVLSVLILLSLAFLVACGSGAGFTHAVPPPSGSFSLSNLNGTYVFSSSGTDINGAPIAIVGTFAANGQGSITGGTLDINDAEFTPTTTFPNNPISNGSYSVSVDGRGQLTLNTNTPFGGTLTFDFVLQDSTHGLLTEFDNNATGSGSIDLQTSGASPTGTYAFLFSGSAVSGTTATSVATTGNFTVGSGGAVSGIEDFNNNGLADAGLALTGSLVLGPSTTPATTFTTTFGTQTYDVFAIDATHLRFIEMDASGTLTGDAFSQTSTALPAGTYAFVLEGAFPVSTGISAAGGFIVTDGNGNITSASTIDANNGGNGASATASFSGTYAASGTGRFLLSNLSGFEGTQYVAYPYSNGLLLLEIDNSGIMAGAAYPQTQNVFAASEGYAFNLSGANLSSIGLGGTAEEVDDIAEFVANSSGTTVTGVLDENYNPSGFPNFALALAGTYAAPDSNGRGQISATAGNSTNSTLNGGFNLNFYTVDGTSFPFIETDGNGQAAAGVFAKQNPSAFSPGMARSHLFVLPSLIKPHAFLRK